MERKARAQTKGALQTADLIATLFERHHHEIFAYIYRLVNQREWAHDLTQETFLRLLRYQERLPQVENHRAWVYRIASNVTFNALKRRRRFQWLPWRQSDALTRHEPDPALQIDCRHRVAAALRTLPPHYRAPLLLFTHYELSVREIAGVLEISEAAVKTRLHRAREMFRNAYQGDEEA